MLLGYARVRPGSQTQPTPLDLTICERETHPHSTDESEVKMALLGSLTKQVVDGNSNPSLPISKAHVETPVRKVLQLVFGLWPPTHTHTNTVLPAHH